MSQAAVTYPLAAISTLLYPEGRKLPGAALFIIPSSLRVILFTNYLKLKLGNLTRLFDTRPQTLKQTKELDSLLPQYSTEFHYCNHDRKEKMRNCTDLWIGWAWGFFVTVATLRGPNKSEKEEAGMQVSSWDEGSQSNTAKMVRIEQQEAFNCSVWQEKKAAFCSEMISHLLSLHTVTMLPRKGCTHAERTYIICSTCFLMSRTTLLNYIVESWAGLYLDMEIFIVRHTC